MKNERLTLLELNGLVREVLELQLPSAYWVEAELSEVREVRGHCYMQLIQKDEGNNTPVAQASARCWKNTWLILRPYFERATGQQLHTGMKVLLQVTAQFHENYGFSWIVNDIDPTYTLGDMVRKRQEIIRQLKEEGVFDLNKELPFPLFAQHIAVISSAGAAGYGDFVNQLEHNEEGFFFSITLFPATMQGEQVERSVIAALDEINGRRDEFDCVVIIRGGGAVADLSGFDTLLLAENVANFPLPIITGIGHDRDESILDMISHTRVKTPTAAAAFLIDHLKRTADRIATAEQHLHNLVQIRLEREQHCLLLLSAHLRGVGSLLRIRQEARLQQLFSRMATTLYLRLEQERLRMNLVNTTLLGTGGLFQQRLTTETHRLQLLEQRADALDPVRLLRRGYSITLHQGHAVKDPSLLSKGDVIETRLEKGTIHSTVT